MTHYNEKDYPYSKLVLLPLLLMAIDYLFVAPGSLCPGELYAGVVNDTVTYGPELCRNFLDYFNHTQETGSMIFHRLMKMYALLLCMVYFFL